LSKAELAWRIERACSNAWPALNEILAGDWAVRFGGGLHRRTNSANPLGPRTRRPAATIEAAEAAYARWDLPAIFRVPSIIEPDMDTRLDLLGYELEAATLTLFGPRGGVSAAPDPAVELTPTPGSDWLAAKLALSGYPPDQALAYPQVVERLAIPALFAALRLEGEIAAVAYGASHDRLFVIEGVVTAQTQRGKGLAGRMLKALFASELAQAAEAVCLQVQADNGPAIALYRRLGLAAEIYRYHYRRKNR
jgi:ribosomal protein S18 acetylase RimI-like enzyme